MKRQKGNMVFFLFFLLLVTSLFAEDSLKTNTKCTYDQIEENLLVGLSSDNEGLKFSSAYFLGEIKSDKAILPLLSLFHNGTNDEMKIIAALSLCKIHSDRGIFAVKRAIKFSDSERVSRMCQIFYNRIMLDEIKSKVEVEEIQLAEEKEFNGYKLSDFRK